MGLDTVLTARTGPYRIPVMQAINLAVAELYRHLIGPEGGAGINGLTLGFREIVTNQYESMLLFQQKNDFLLCFHSETNCLLQYTQKEWENFKCFLSTLPIQYF